MIKIFPLLKKSNSNSPFEIPIILAKGLRHMFLWADLVDVYLMIDLHKLLMSMFNDSVWIVNIMNQQTAPLLSLKQAFFNALLNLGFSVCISFSLVNDYFTNAVFFTSAISVPKLHLHGLWNKTKLRRINDIIAFNKCNFIRRNNT